MNKIKVSKKEIKEGYKNVIKVGYCGIQTLLSYKNANFYSCGVYGWSCDYYVINDNTIISTGYDPVGNIQPDYKIISEYEQKAQQIVGKWLGYETTTKKLDQLLNKFIKEVVKD